MHTAIRVLAVAALLLVALAATEDSTPAEAKVDAAILSGGDLPHPIALAFEDAYAFWALPRSRSDLDLPEGWPTRLDAAPFNPGTGYELQSGLAAALLGNNPYGLWRDVEFGERRLPRATYYPAAAALELRIGDDPARWAHFDDDRARILNRYIELGCTGALPEQPSVLDVLAAEARAGRTPPVTIDGRPLSSATLEAFWHTADLTSWPEVPVFGSRLGAKAHTGAPTDYDQAVDAMVYGYADPVRLSFDVDGREVRLAYYGATGVIAGLPLPSNSAWIGRGFVIPPELREAFHASLGLPPRSPPPAAVEALAPVPRGGSPADSTSDTRFEGRVGGATALALLGVVGLAAVASGALVRGVRRRLTA